ncbi:MAG: CinA family protein [Euryarchaeota archaeon]|nr:CinA family protein [Euryarchaeota archaeon]
MASARRVLELLRARGLTLAVAESFTGGRVQDLLTDVAGSSDVFRGGVVAYANDVKIRILGVRSATIRRHGAVSHAAAGELAKAVRRLLRADVGLATTGIAGPTGSTATKPLGLTFVALAMGRRLLVERRVFRGGRDAVKARATQLALDLAVKAVRKR